MFLVMGITGKVGGATAEHLLAHGKEVRALVRNREKASSWANQGVELVDGDWNDSAAIERALKESTHCGPPDNVVIGYLRIHALGSSGARGPPEATRRWSLAQARWLDTETTSPTM